MRRLYFKQFAWTLLFCLPMLFVASCSASKSTSDSTADNTEMEVNSPEINISDKDEIQRNALRIKAKVLNDGVEEGKTEVYELEVTEVLSYGASFTSVEPAVGEKIILSAPQQSSYKKGSIITVDIRTPRVRTEGILKVRQTIK